MYDPQSGRISVTRNLHFDEANCYDKKDLRPQDFAVDEWNKEDDELFADSTDILDADEPILELNSIPHKGFETNPYSEESRVSSPLSDIPDSVRDEEEENNNNTPDDQPKSEIKEWSHLQLNRRDRDSSIQLSDIVPKGSRQERLVDLTPGSQKFTCIKDETTTSANVMCLASTTPSVSKSHIHTVTVLANLNAGYDDSGPDEPLSLKEAMALPY